LKTNLRNLQAKHQSFFLTFVDHALNNICNLGGMSPICCGVEFSAAIGLIQVIQITDMQTI